MNNNPKWNNQVARVKPGPRKRKEENIVAYFDAMSPNTVIKYDLIMKDYYKLKRDATRSFPEIAAYISEGFYYTMMCRRWKMSRGHLISIISRLEANQEHFKRAIQVAHMTIEADEWIRDKKNIQPKRKAKKKHYVKL